MTIASGNRKDDEKGAIGPGGSGTVKGVNETQDDMIISKPGQEPSGAGVAPNIGQDVQQHLGRKLKSAYDELVRQPIPDKIRELLEQLSRRENQE